MFSLKRPAVVLAGMSVLLGMLLTAAPPAQAQQADCLPRDPYTGGQPCHTDPVCTASVALQGRERVVATGFAPGDRLTGSIDGHVVFVVDTSDGNVDVTFTMPALAPGSYGLAVAGSPSGQLCDPEFEIAGAGAAVQGQSFSRPSGSSGTSGVGPLARTGLGIMAILAAGLAAILAGYSLRRASRRQHRRHPRRG